MMTSNRRKKCAFKQTAPTQLARACRLCHVLPILICAFVCGCAHPGPFVADTQFTVANAPPNAIWLDTLDLSHMDQGWSKPAAGKTVDGKPLTLAGQVFTRGVGTHAYSELLIDLGGNATWFKSVVGIDDEVGQRGAVVFRVWVDGKEAWHSRELRGGARPQTVQVNLEGARELVLSVDAATQSIDYCHADWAGAMIGMKPGAAPPRTLSLSDDRVPEIWRLGSVVPDPIVGSAPAQTSMRRGLALTPPMGWNSWNVWGTAVDDTKVRAAADSLVSSGLAAAGFIYVNIDDGWEAGRDAQGRILCNEKFPAMKALADYVHAKGLKLGIYSSPGPKTCADYEGSYGHEFQDAKSYAEWGIDLLKYDWCSYGQIAKDESLPELKKPYLLMRDALKASGRDIVYSLCQYGKGNVWEWGESVGGHYWRTTGDITDSWARMSEIGFGQNGLEKHAGPGHWNDPDMLVVGKLGWGPNVRPTKLSPHEQHTHMTLWCMLAAPLLIGCDLTQLDDFTLALLANPEVIAIDQDPLGQQGRRVAQTGSITRGPNADVCEVWARPLADNSMAVGLFNRGRKDVVVEISWRKLGLKGPQHIRDLWQRRNLGRLDDRYSATIPSHGAMLIKLSPIGK